MKARLPEGGYTLPGAQSFADRVSRYRSSAQSRSRLLILHGDSRGSDRGRESRRIKESRPISSRSPRAATAATQSLDSRSRVGRPYRDFGQQWGGGDFTPTRDRAQPRDPLTQFDKGSSNSQVIEPLSPPPPPYGSAGRLRLNSFRNCAMTLAGWAAW